MHSNEAGSLTRTRRRPPVVPNPDEQAPAPSPPRIRVGGGRTVAVTQTQAPPGYPSVSYTPSQRAQAASRGLSPKQKKAIKRQKVVSRDRQGVVQNAEKALKQSAKVFTKEGLYHQAYIRNKNFAKPGPYETKLSPNMELHFQKWVSTLPKDIRPPLHNRTDYDYRGYFKQTVHQTGQPPGSHNAGQHFTDEFKKPYDTTFSRESKYANKKNPLVWKGNKLVNRNTGNIRFAPAGLAKKLNLIPIKPHLRRAPQASPQQKQRVAHKLKKASARRTTPVAGFSQNAQTFASSLAHLTGHSPAFIASWMKHEYDPSQPQTAGTPGVSGSGTANQDWLAVGFPGHQTPTSENPKWWSDPVSAAHATYRYLKGTLPGYIAPSDITNAILNTHNDATAGALLSQTNYAGAPGTYNPADLMSSIQTGKAKPIPPALKQRAQQVLGAKKTKQIIHGSQSKPDISSLPAPKIITKAIQRYGKGTVIREPQASAGGALAVVNKGDGPEIYKALQALSAKLHTKVYVTSGYRTDAQSSSLAAGSAGDPHTEGKAFDIGVGSPTIASVASVPESVLNSVGLYRPYYPASAGEANHVELIGAGDGTGDPASGAGTPASLSSSSYSAGTVSGGATTGTVSGGASTSTETSKGRPARRRGKSARQLQIAADRKKVVKGAIASLAPITKKPKTASKTSSVPASAKIDLGLA